jgi:hypothetical protein
MRTMRVTTLACVALLALGVGCRDRSTAQDKEDTLCVELGKVDATITKIASIAASGGNASQLPQLRAELDTKWRGVEAAAKDVSAVKIDGVRTAYQNFLKTLNGVNNQATLAAGQPAIDRAAGDFAVARLDLYDAAGCS